MTFDEDNKYKLVAQYSRAACCYRCGYQCSLFISGLEEIASNIDLGLKHLSTFF